MMLIAQAVLLLLHCSTSSSQRAEYGCQLKEGCQVHCDPNKAERQAKLNNRYPLRCRLQGANEEQIPIKLFQDNKARLTDLSQKIVEITEDRIKWQNLTEKINAVMQERQKQIARQEQEISRLNSRISSLVNMDTKVRRDILDLKEKHRVQNVKMRRLESENLDLWREVIKLKNDGVEPEKAKCQFETSTHCFWIDIKVEWNVELKDGKLMCRNGGGRLALIPNQKIYDDIVKYLRNRMPRGSDTLFLWVAMTYDPTSTQASPSDSFYSWKKGFPMNGERNRLATNIYIEVYELILEGAKPEDDTGMMNGEPDWRLNGAVCERPKS